MAFFNNGGSNNSFGGPNANPGNGMFFGATNNYGTPGSMDPRQSTAMGNGWNGIAPNQQGVSFPGNSGPQAVSPRPSVLPGRMINSEEDIRPNEILMDGSISLFPLQDGSAIIAKAWNSNGLIDRIKFVPELPQQVAITPPEPTEFEKRTTETLEDIKAMIANNIRHPQQKPNKQFDNKQNNQTEAKE